MALKNASDDDPYKVHIKNASRKRRGGAEWMALMSGDLKTGLILVVKFMEILNTKY